MEQVKNKALPEENATSLDLMRTDNACPMHHLAARLISPFSSASHSRRHSEGHNMKSPARETKLKGGKENPWIGN
jgi:hypothetical protein